MSQTLQRIDASSARLDSLGNESKEWFKSVPHALRSQQYKSRLAELESFVTDTLAILRDELKKVTGQTPIPEGFRDCRRSDLRATWLRRVWRSYADRFDQRIGGPWKGLLEAADEVIWSCYEGVRQRGASGAVAAPPLTYVDEAYSPAALLRKPSRIPPEFDNANDVEFVKEVLRSIPVPLIVLPSEWRESPWWMVLLAHETAHHLQSMLLPVVEEGDPFQQVVVAAARKSDTEYQLYSVLWKDWSAELFADAFSVPLVGTAAAEAIARLSWSDAEAMAHHPASYPPAETRVEFLNRLVSILKLPASLMPSEHTNSNAVYSRIANDVAAAALSPIRSARGEVSLVESAGFAIGDFTSPIINNVQVPGSVATWTKELTAAARGREQLTPIRRTEMPRLAVAASWRAWRNLANEAGDDLAALQEREAKPAGASLKLIAACSEPMTRSTGQARPLPDLASAFVDQFSAPGVLPMWG